MDFLNPNTLVTFCHLIELVLKYFVNIFSIAQSMLPASLDASEECCNNTIGLNIISLP